MITPGLSLYVSVYVFKCGEVELLEHPFHEDVGE
jgi:hypothetical protein